MWQFLLFTVLYTTLLLVFLYKKTSINSWTAQFLAFPVNMLIMLTCTWNIGLSSAWFVQ